MVWGRDLIFVLLYVCFYLTIFLHSLAVSPFSILVSPCSSRKLLFPRDWRQAYCSLDSILVHNVQVLCAITHWGLKGSAGFRKGVASPHQIQFQIRLWCDVSVLGIMWQDAKMHLPFLGLGLLFNERFFVCVARNCTHRQSYSFFICLIETVLNWE